MKDTLKTLTTKWKKAKAKLQKIQAKELDLRMQMDLLMAGKGELTAKVTYGSENVNLKRNLNYSIPAASYVDLKSKLDKEIFKDTFSVAYKIKPAVYEKMSGKNKEIIDEHLTIKASPLSATIKEA